MTEFSHSPVLLEETIEMLRVKEDGIYIDGTVGGAGHSSRIASLLGANGRLIGIDRDEDAVKASSERLKKFGDIATVVRGSYGDMPEIAAGLGITKADGILLDLGVSSHQLDDEERGFSYRTDAPLDMRMDRRQEKTARDIVNLYTEEELRHLIWDYGEERFAPQIAKHIVRARQEKEIETTGELAGIILSSIPSKYRKAGGHPAKRTFQAIRIELNGELDILGDCLGSLIGLLAEGGRLAVITFHSLEDRIVKNAFNTAEKPCICPPDFPVCVCGRKSQGHVITRKPILPSGEEMERNPRSKSAKLRVFEKSTEK
ncbi:MAG: 16S rRNA (cytosine(1402)-N(4))-methyltransferase RsmH [Lachnospiraceae bacterium]|nr:16S rRNA (cytosine(1402)-N(4))-methyltransferase RsmH [Lachnospiraceae bacterium]